MSRSTARIARAIDEGEPIVQQPHRLIEENMWRAIRYGLSGELIDLERGDVLPARARIERLIEWVRRSRPRSAPPTGCASPSRTPPSARSRGSREGDELAEIYGDLVVRPSRVG